MAFIRKTHTNKATSIPNSIKRQVVNGYNYKVSFPLYPYNRCNETITVYLTLDGKLSQKKIENNCGYQRININDSKLPSILKFIKEKYKDLLSGAILKKAWYQFAVFGINYKLTYSLPNNDKLTFVVF